MLLDGCSGPGIDKWAEEGGPEVPVFIEIGWSEYATRASMPDEEKVTDISLMFFDSMGRLEREMYLTDENGSWEGNITANMTLLSGMK